MNMKLYMPLNGILVIKEYNFETGCGEFEGSMEQEMDSYLLMPYKEEIRDALYANRMPEEEERGLMHWYGEDDELNRVVKSVVFDVEEREGRLWGVADCEVTEAAELNKVLAELKGYISGQASDGWGEGFEQREIEVSEGTLYVSLWHPKDWSMETETERFGKTEKQSQGMSQSM